MLLVSALETYPAVTPAALLEQGTQGIVVLTGGNYTGPEYGKVAPGSDALPRLHYAVFLHRHTGLPIVISGGVPNDGRGISLARAMADSLRDEYGITGVILEEQARTTADHARFLPAILDAQGIKRVAIVSHAWHLPRAIAVFRGAGIDATAAPTQFTFGRNNESWLQLVLPSPAAMGLVYTALHEWAGRVWYEIRYD